MTVKKRFFALLLVLTLTFGLAGCVNEYTVFFETNGGNDIQSITVSGKAEVPQPEDPIKEGFDFVGWYADEDLTEEFSFNSPISSDLTIYAKWEEAIFSIRFEGPNGDLIYSVDYHEGDSLADFEYPEDPELEGLIFLGWDNELPSVMPDHDIVITAVALDFETIQIALVTDVLGIDDGGINEEIWNAIIQYGEANDLTYAYYQPLGASLENYEYVITLAAFMGAQIIICPGYIYEVAVYEMQQVFTDIQFIIIDGFPHNEEYSDYLVTENTTAITFDTNQAGFLAGYAAVMEGYTELGFVGGMQIPPVLTYGYGFVRGAEYAATELGLPDDSINIKFRITNNFSMDEFEQILMTQWYNSGTEVIFSIAGELNQSVLIAAEETQGLMIGVDYDMSSISDVYLTSAIKQWGNVVDYLLWSFFENSFNWESQFAGQILEFGACVDAVGLPIGDAWRFETFTMDEYQIIFDLLASEILVLEETLTMPVTNKVVIVLIN